MNTSRSQPEELIASRVAAGLSVGMALFKFVIGWASGSLSLMASGLDSIFDAATSFTGYILLKMSLEPADKEHPYGHSRIESVASLAQGALLLFIALALAYTASRRFDHLHEPHNLHAAIFVPFFCALITAFLWVYMGRVVKRTGSTVIAADRFHYFGDLAGNILLVVGFLAAKFWHVFNVDAILTVALSLFMLVGGLKIIADSIKELVDYNDPEVESHIKKALAQFYPEALGTSRLRTRRSGRRTALDLELLTCRQLKFQEVHDISHKIQQSILSAMPHLDIIIHSEPCGPGQCAHDKDCQYQAHFKNNGVSSKSR